MNIKSILPDGTQFLLFGISIFQTLTNWIILSFCIAILYSIKLFHYLLISEVMNETSNEQISNPKPCIICGPSGVGKGTLLNKMKQSFPNIFGVSVSHTTRQPRNGEVNGIAYNFITRKEFEKGIENDEFLETKQYSGNYYGTSFKAIENVQKQNKICILEIHVTSAKYIKENCTNLDCNYIFITCDGDKSLQTRLNTLEKRLRQRNTENDEQINKRLNAAEEEFTFLKENDGFFGCVVSNDNLEESMNALINQFKTWYPWIESAELSLVSNIYVIYSLSFCIHLLINCTMCHTAK